MCNKGVSVLINDYFFSNVCSKNEQNEKSYYSDGFQLIVFLYNMYFILSHYNVDFQKCIANLDIIIFFSNKKNPIGTTVAHNRSSCSIFFRQMCGPNWDHSDGFSTHRIFFKCVFYRRSSNVDFQKSAHAHLFRSMSISSFHPCWDFRLKIRILRLLLLPLL